MQKYLILLVALVLSISMPGFAEAKVSDFADINLNHWAKPYIDSLKSLEIISGYSDGTFRPSSDVKVSEFIAMTVKALGYRFESKSSDWAKPYVEKAIELGLIEDREFSSYTADINREQMASIVVGAISLSENLPPSTLDQHIKTETKDYYLISDYYKQAILDSYKLGVINGYSDKTFRPKDFSNRAQAAAMISRIINREFRTPYEKLDARYTVVPVHDLDKFGNKIASDFTLYAPFSNNSQHTEMIDVVELLMKYTENQMGNIDARYVPYINKLSITGYESREIKEWIESLDFSEQQLNGDLFAGVSISVDFNDFTSKNKPYEISFKKRPSILEKSSSYSSFFTSVYGDQLLPLFQYLFSTDDHSAWNLLIAGLDTRGETKVNEYSLNGRTVTIYSGSDICRIIITLKK